MEHCGGAAGVGITLVVDVGVALAVPQHLGMSSGSFPECLDQHHCHCLCHFHGVLVAHDRWEALHLVNGRDKELDAVSIESLLFPNTLIKILHYSTTLSEAQE
jgi:hypothetical protein